MPKKIKKNCSFNERLFIVVDNLCPPIVNQFLLEGNGTPEISKWKEAIEIASNANPGSRYRLKGHLGFSHWIDSEKTPPLREVDGNGWDGTSSEDAPFLLKRLNPFSGPTCEVLIIYGNPNRIIFRTHHGVMDGRGTTIWADDIFRALRGEPVLGSDPLISEKELLNMLPDVVEKPIPHEYIAPTGKADTNEHGLTWRRISIKGRFKKLLPKIMILIAQESWENSDGRVRFGIPVDMRSRKQGIRSTNNLTNAFFIEVTPESTPDELSEIISKRLENQIDGVYTWEDKIITYIPIKILEKVLVKQTFNSFNSGNYRYSAFVSNLGRIDLEKYTGGGFKPDTCFFIPPGIEFLPFGLTLTGSGGTIELALTIPNALANNGRIDNILNNISNSLEQMAIEYI